MKLDLAKARAGVRLLIATHTHGIFVPQYVESLARLTGHLAKWGIPHGVVIVKDCFVEVGRDRAAWAMLAGEFTHLLFLDADIAFEPEDVAALIAADKDIVAGAYRVKTDGDQPQYAVRLAEDSNGNAAWDSEAQAFLAEGAATGFMLIRREVFERMCDEMPGIRYRDEVHRKDRFAFFEMVAKDGLRVSEDYAFCRRWRALGGEVWVMPGLNLAHYGERVWRGRMADTIPELQ